MAVPIRPPTTQQILPRGPYVGVVASISGAGLGWLVSRAFTELGGLVRSYGALDVVVLGLAGASMGALFQGFTALRRDGRAWAEAARGAGVGLLAGLLAGIVGVAIGSGLSSRAGVQGFLIARLLVWGLFGGSIGAVLAARFIDIDPRRPVDGLVFGLLSGLLAALILSLPGPTEIWQLLAFVVVGLGAGFGASRLRRALGIVSTLPPADRPGDLWSLREWELYDGRSLVLEGGATISAAQGRVEVRSSGADRTTLGGRAVTAPAELGERQLLTIGGRRYQFSRLPKVVG